MWRSGAQLNRLVFAEPASTRLAGIFVAVTMHDTQTTDDSFTELASPDPQSLQQNNILMSGGGGGWGFAWRAVAIAISHLSTF